MVFAIIGIIALAAYLLTSQGAVAETTGGPSMYKSTSTVTGSPITNDRSTWPSGDKLWDMAKAIAIAEGYERGQGVVPFDLNNPGDISDGANTYGSQVHSGSHVTTFPDAETGWQWLYNKLSNIVNGTSETYPADLDWQGVSQKWAGNSATWVANVTRELGVDSNSTPADYYNS